jgi:DHA1 family bicyclomycin/chloramphenicol resistance-like MFS transporter
MTSETLVRLGIGFSMQPTPRTPSRLFSLALALTALISPLAVHIFLPVIPAVKAELALSNAQAQFTFSIALFAMAFATLVYGSLSDRFGRRPILLSGLALFLLGSAMSAVAETIGTLTLGRLVQAIGAACSMTLLRVIARDAYRAEYLVRAIAYLTMFYTLGPMFSPIVGGALVDTLGWRSVFVFSFAAGGAITFAVYAAIPETRPASVVAASDVGILRPYGALLRVPLFTAFVLQSGLNTGAFMTLASASSTLMKDVLNRPATEYGLYFLLFPIGYFLGTVLSSRVGSRASNETMVLIGSTLSVTSVLTQALLLLNGIVSPITIFVPGFFLTMSQGIALPYSQVGAMAVIPTLAGTAAGISVFMQNFCGALFAQIYGLFSDGTPRPMVFIISLCGLLCFSAGVVPFWLARQAAVAER